MTLTVTHLAAGIAVPAFVLFGLGHVGCLAACVHDSRVTTHEETRNTARLGSVARLIRAQCMVYDGSARLARFRSSLIGQGYLQLASLSNVC